MTSRGTKYWSTGSIPLIGPDVLGDIIANAADIALVLSETGEVLSVLVGTDDSASEALAGWEGRDIRESLTVESVPKIDRVLESLIRGERDLKTIELNHISETGLDFPVRYAFQAVGPDGAILMLGRDLRPVAEMQQQLVRAQMTLERDYETQREIETRFRVLLEVTRDPLVFVSQASGRIVEANPAALALLGAGGENLSDTPFASEFENRRKGDIMSLLAAQAITDDAAPIELTTRRSRRPVTATGTAFRAAGERMILCRLAPADDKAEMADGGLSEDLAALFADGCDGIVFTNEAGVITAANEAFLSLIDAANSSQLRQRTLADFLSRGGVDLRVLIDNARRSGHMRLYATRVVSEYGHETQVEVSATWLNDRAEPAVVFVLRDVSRAENLRAPGVAIGDEGVKSVMELVGSATLKDIVSETTDVIEKMCIETAVELTNNNRVAAAEMLGLSRQSLYVKLRKYGMLSRDD